MDWLFDFGNTRVKWATAADGALYGPVRAYAHGGPAWQEALAADLAAYGGVPDRAWIAAVASEEAVSTVVDLLRAHWPKLDPVKVATPAAGAGVRVAYAEPARFGVDRYLAMVGARARSAGDWLVVGAGTALTIDLLDAAGTHHGGLIAPSPALMIEAIERRTARVRVDREPKRAEFATDTAAALYSGAWNAAIALVERAATQAAAELGRAPPPVLMHGGDAQRLAAMLPQASIAPALVLEGLARHVAAADGM
jgi:type III pantothenate kinase